MKNIYVNIFLISFLALTSAFAQKRSGPLNGEIVLEKVVRDFAEVRDFVAAIDAEINMERVQVPKMHATMYFKRPDKIHFTSQGFLLIPRDGLTLNPAVLSERYDASFIAEDTLEGRRLYKLQLAAKDKKTKLRQMYAWIDPAHWTVSRIETIPYEGRTLSIVFTYEFLQDKFWLPSKLVVTFGTTSEGEKITDDSTNHQMGQFSQMYRSMPRNGSITIQYSDYKVNVGLDDSIFEDNE
jgi:outer membrane lipoprotein-sorting protein